MEHNNKKHGWWCSGVCHSKSGSLGWGIFFLVMGGFFLARELGYITADVSLWTILFLALGGYLVGKSLAK